MVQALISTRFLEYFQKFSSFCVEDFQNSSEINLDSFQFIQTLLYANKCEWILNISTSAIIDFKTLPLEKINENNREIAIMLKSDRRNIINGNPELYREITTGDHRKIHKENLPQYLFLGDVSKEICEDFERSLGIIVLSTKHIRLAEDKIKVIFKNIRNTKDAIFEELKTIPFNSIKISDPFFAERYSANQGENFLCKLSYYTALCIIDITTSYGKTASQKVLETIESYLTNKFINCKCSVITGAGHDRLIFTNTATITIGNSLLTGTKSTYTQFPIGIYGREMFH